MFSDLDGASLADARLPMAEVWRQWVARLRNTTTGEP